MLLLSRKSGAYYEDKVYKYLTKRMPCPYSFVCFSRAYFEKKIDLTDVEDKLQSNEFSIDEYNIEENWHEYISDSEKRKKLSALRPIERRAYYLNTVMKMAHRDISLILLTPRRSISRWIVKIAEILK